jgi:uncharacterized membrane protein
MKIFTLRFWVDVCFGLTFLVNMAFIYMSLVYQLLSFTVGAILLSVFQVWLHKNYGRDKSTH